MGFGPDSSVLGAFVSPYLDIYLQQLTCPARTPGVPKISSVAVIDGCDLYNGDIRQTLGLPSQQPIQYSAGVRRTTLTLNYVIYQSMLALEGSYH